MGMKASLITVLTLQLTLGGGRNIDPQVHIKPYFPPALPTLENLNTLCLQGNGRPRYPASCLPASGYGYVHRAGNAVNKIEAWFSQCCNRGVAQGNKQILCCAKQAWKTGLSHFCFEEYATMDLTHKCCKKKGKGRWNCFEEQAPNPSYLPLPSYTAPLIPLDQIFTWDPKIC
ncbi:extracellular matrix protein 1-like isoform X2 [Myxocyprinus asiaticus]|uniref:extracellular matrix protein 1-like isoform X2 n=1 Tax=Myxocyprinus asiaticus TaxID=70543 RepID=UPI002222297F|nr:extracellular matrix protein 1-like isoform X2 [Myxocyprinus asiaticus]